MPKELTLITGASMGIGAELAREFASHGHDLVLVARSTDKLNILAAELKEKFKINTHILSKDLLTSSACEELYMEVKKKNLNVEILVNNAGFGLHGFFNETDLKKETDMIELNIKVLTKLSKLFLKDMVQNKKGKILNTASTAAYFPGPLMSVYYATKAYVVSFSHALACELKRSGVTVSALCPGFTESDFHKNAEIDFKRASDMLRMPAERVAKTAYQGLMRHKQIIVPGLRNQLMVFLSKITTKNFQASLNSVFQNKR
jgi:short-subunit dehydrogenase